MGTSERKKSAPALPPIVTQQPPSAEASSDEEEDDDDDEDENDGVGTNVELGAAQSSSNQRSRSQSIQLANKAKFGSKGALHSPIGSAHSFDLQVSYATDLAAAAAVAFIHCAVLYQCCCLSLLYSVIFLCCFTCVCYKSSKEAANHCNLP